MSFDLPGPIAFTLSGGVALGAIHVGYGRALYEAGIAPTHALRSTTRADLLGLPEDITVIYLPGPCPPPRAPRRYAGDALTARWWPIGGTL